MRKHVRNLLETAEDYRRRPVRLLLLACLLRDNVNAIKYAGCFCVHVTVNIDSTRR